MKPIVEKNQTQLPDCQKAVGKSLLKVIFTVFLGSILAIIQFTEGFDFFLLKHVFLSVKENSQNLGTLPSMVLKISQKTQNNLD